MNEAGMNGAGCIQEHHDACSCENRKLASDAGKITVETLEEGYAETLKNSGV